ncbi:MAG: hypothetical protein ACFFDN_00175 [Candidatus Hodarchaeota archaeon]
MKKPQKRKKRTMKRQLFFGIMLFSAIFLLIVSATLRATSTNVKETETNTIINEHLQSPPSSAGYQSFIDIDCLRLESGYEHIIDDPNYDVWYANNETRHFLFINSSSNLTGKSILIYTEEFNYSLTPEKVSTSFLLSYHVNKTLEFAIERILLGYYGEETNEFSLFIGTDIINLYVGPASPSSGGVTIPPYIGEGDDGETEYIRLGIVEGWIYDIEQMSTGELIFWTAFYISAIWILVFIIIRERNLLFKNPIVVVGNTVPDYVWDKYIPKKERDTDEEGHEVDYGKDIIKLGRYVMEQNSNLLSGFYELFFKHGKRFILKIFCKERYEDIKGTRKRGVNIIQLEHWDYQVVLFELPEDIRPREKILRKGFKNRLLRFIARRIPSKRLPIKIEEKHLEYDYTKKRVKYIILLQNIYDQNHFTVRIDATFKRKIPDAKNPNKMKVEYLKNEPYYKYELLKLDKTVDQKSIQAIIRGVDVYPVDKKHRAFRRQSEDNLRSQISFERAKSLKEKEEQDNIIDSLTQKITSMKKEYQTDYRRDIEQFMESGITPYQKFAEGFISTYKLTGDIKLALHSGYKEALKNEEVIKQKDITAKLQKKLEKYDNPNYILELEFENKQLRHIVERRSKQRNPSKEELSLEEELDFIINPKKKNEEEY